MSLTIDGAIARFEANAEQNERWASGGLNPEANAEYAAEHRQLAAWLRELQERREKDNKIGRGNAIWLINSDGYYPYCSACMTEPKDGIMTDFCPSCGAKMEGKIT